MRETFVLHLCKCKSLPRFQGMKGSTLLVLDTTGALSIHIDSYGNSAAITAERELESEEGWQMLKEKKESKLCRVLSSEPDAIRSAYHNLEKAILADGHFCQTLSTHQTKLPGGKSCDGRDEPKGSFTASFFPLALEAVALWGCSWCIRMGWNTWSVQAKAKTAARMVWF